MWASHTGFPSPNGGSCLACSSIRGTGLKLETGVGHVCIEFWICERPLLWELVLRSKVVSDCWGPSGVGRSGPSGAGGGSSVNLAAS